MKKTLEDSYHYEGGIKSYVELLNENKEPIHDEPIYIHQSKDDIEVEIAIQYNSGYATNLLTYANNIHTKVVRMKTDSNVH